MELHSEGMEQRRYGHSPMADATLAGDRMAIYHRASRNAITLNPAGTHLWQVLTAPRTVADLAHELQEKWTHLDEDKARQDVDAFLVQLRMHDLIIEI